MKLFTVSELWGPYKCEHPGCGKRKAFTIKLTEEEYSQLPEKTGSVAITYICQKKLGVALCEEHLPI